ncbi:NUDIX hydrolase [Salarchaeum sp. JOR-1]|uniref:NUDIX hydrolase n=1 Tax=Salarchaeum sp. JOR-1 TaxID=2599399 RepID=UPI0011989D3F|nr:NUDIX hydrolase [Salarchaeum sp. JOR-1]QDX40539.1 NUDIX hydrolase [Salarchaeum sp. JOR-1]
MSDDDLAWTTRERAVAYSCPGFDVVREDVTLPDGTQTDFDYLSEPPAVVVLPFTDDGEVVVIEEWRQAVDRVNRGLPAGGTEPEDAADLAAAARRELREETGYEADSLEPLTTVEPANGYADSVHHHFVARGCTPTGEQDLDHDETIRVDTAEFDDLVAAAAAGDLRDARTVVGVLTYHVS